MEMRNGSDDDDDDDEDGRETNVIIFWTRCDTTRRDDIKVRG